MITFEDIIDFYEFEKLASNIWHEYWPCILSPAQIDYMLEKFQSVSAVSEQVKNENYKYFYIVLDGIKVGYIGLSFKNDYLFLSKLYLKKDFRYKGIGRKAFEFIKQLCIKNDFNKITLTVNKNNKQTIKIYNKWGFLIKNAVVSDIGSGFVMDDYVMEWKI